MIEEQLPRGWEVQRLWDRQELGGGSEKSYDWEEVVELHKPQLERWMQGCA